MSLQCWLLVLLALSLVQAGTLYASEAGLSQVNVQKRLVLSEMIQRQEQSNIENVFVKRYSFSNDYISKLYSIEVSKHGPKKRNNIAHMPIIVQVSYHGQILIRDPNSYQVLMTYFTNVDVVDFSIVGMKIILTSKKNSTVVVGLRLYQGKRIVAGNMLHWRTASMTIDKIRHLQCAAYSPGMYGALTTEFENTLCELSVWYLPKGRPVHVYVAPRKGIYFDAMMDVEISPKDGTFVVPSMFRQRLYLMYINANVGKIQVVFGKNQSTIANMFTRSKIDAASMITNSVLAIAWENHVSFLSLMTKSISFGHCHGILHPISSIQRDTMHRGQFYVADIKGNGYIYQTKIVQTNTQFNVKSCVLKQYFRPKQYTRTTHAGMVTSAIGITLLASHRLTVYDMLDKNNARYLGEVESNTKTIQVSSARSENGHAYFLHTYGTNETSRTDVYEYLVPYERVEGYDISWIRGPLMMIGAVCILVYQRKQKKCTNFDSASFKSFAQDFNKWDRKHGGNGLPSEIYDKKHM